MDSPPIGTREARNKWLEQGTTISPLTSPSPKRGSTPKRGRTDKIRYRGKKGRRNSPYPRKTRKKKHALRSNN